MSDTNLGNFEIHSNLTPGEKIPEDYYGNSFGYTNKNVSPSLEWKNAPAGTKSFAVTFYDQDAPTGSGFWHYVLFDIPAGVNKIELGALSAGKIPSGSVESITDAGKPGYLGPCPPPGREHTYIYAVHALKVEKLGVPTSSTPGFVGFNLWANSVGKTSFTVRAGKKN
jgi:Raf kinase inhibitor-like YbhB/YbcL family protein